MKFSVAFLTKLYQYATAFIIVASPLFFIPGTGFTPEVTYFIVVTVVTTIALCAYVLQAFLTKTWHSVSRLEFFSYFIFSGAVLLSVLFAQDRKLTFFGDAFNQFSALTLLLLPVIIYLVRTLPEALRLRMKYVLAIILGVSAFVLMSALMFNGAIVETMKQLFLGFSNVTSLSAYLGVFVLGAFFYSRKAKLPTRHKVIIVIGTIVFFAWIVSIAYTDAVRPDFTSSLLVGKSVLANDGIFGIGAGNFARAWELYRPESVVASQYFGYEFNQGYSTITTLLSTIGIVGVIAFLFLTLSALFSTWKTYKRTHEGKEHFVTGLLAIILLYLSVLSWVLPLSFSMMVVWMVVAGFGFAKAPLTEYHPSKKLAFLFVPLAVVLLVSATMSEVKVRAFMLFGKSQVAMSSEGATDKVGSLLSQAIAIYPYDGFYRAQVEYIIAQERNLVSTTAVDQTSLQNTYSQKAQGAVDAGLAAVKANGNNYQNYVSLGRAYELAIPFDKENGYANAKKSYNQAVKLYSGNPYLYVMLARLEASAGTKEGVRLQLTEALKKKQNFADALYLMSQLEASDQKMDEALTYAQEAVKNAPNDPLVYIQAGLLYYGKKDYQNAVTSLNTALEKDPNNANVAFFLALSLRDGGRPDLAKVIADELIKRNPNNKDVQALESSLATKPAPAVVTTKK